MIVLFLGLTSCGLPTSNASIDGGGCSGESVAMLVRDFVRAYNAGDSAALEEMWASEPDFEWYSVSPRERLRDDAYDRATLIPYFEDRHQLGDRMRLRALNVGPPDERGFYGISYRLRRRSDDPSGRGRYHGKASAREITSVASPAGSTPAVSAAPRCVLFVWSMGRKPRSEAAP